MRIAEAEALPVCTEASTEPGAPSSRTESFVGRLVDETIAGNPVPGVVLRAVVGRILVASPGRDRTFCGNDASAGVIEAISDAMVWTRQLQEEVLQCQMDAVGSVDARAMISLLDVAGLLQVTLRQAIEVHARLHGAVED